MRRTALAALALLALAAPAHGAPAPQVTDPAGDANFTGTGVPTAPASYATLDITSVRWWADAGAQHASLALADSDRAAPAKYVLRVAPPSCATTTLAWQPEWDVALLTGCKPRHQRRYAPPRWSGDTLTFTLPRSGLPSWLAPGTTVHGLGATTAPVQEYVVGQLHPPVDDASGETRYVVGS